MNRFLLFFISISLFSNEYIYLDGSANEYILFSKDKNYFLKYNPVKKENSSSGIYSGGEKKQVSISKEDFIAFKIRFKKALKSKFFTEKREMMTGYIYIKKKEKILEEKILLPNSPEKHELERTLKQILEGF